MKIQTQAFLAPISLASLTPFTHFVRSTRRDARASLAIGIYMKIQTQAFLIMVVTCDPPAIGLVFEPQ
jgi:hypothetical protein